MPVQETGAESLPCRCVLVKELCHQVKELFEQGTRLSSICENKKETRYSQRPCRLFSWDISKEMCLLEINRPDTSINRKMFSMALTVNPFKYDNENVLPNSSVKTAI